MNRVTSAAAVTALLLAIAACGTTVPQAGQSASDGDLGGSGTTGTAPATAGSASGDSASVGSGSGGAIAGASSTTGGGSSSSGARGTATAATTAGTALSGTSASPNSVSASQAASSIPATGRGWDRTNVYLGMIDASDIGAAVGALGVSASPGDQTGDARAIQDELNRNGGLFGRQVKILIHDNKSADISANPSSAAQANCTYFTQDHPVIAVVNPVSPLDIDTLRSCLAQHRTPLLGATLRTLDDKLFSSLNPYFYGLLAVSYDKLVPTLVAHLKAQSYFTGWSTTTGTAGSAPVKVGVLYGTDDNVSPRVKDRLLAELKAAGYATDSFGAANPGDYQSAVLKFAGNGVTHVIGLDYQMFYFVTAANSQQYYPRYGVSSYDGLQVLLEANAPPAALAGAVGVGWLPAVDVRQDKDPGSVGPAQTACLTALSKKGIHYGSQRFAIAIAEALCDGFGLVTQAAKTSGGLDTASIRTGIIALGSHFQSAIAFSNGLSAGNPAIPSSARNIWYDPACKCFSYRGPKYAL